MKKAKDHCENNRCHDPHCDNPHCYNYDKSSHRHYESPHHHGHGHHDANDILHRHHYRQDHYEDAREDVSLHQQQQKVKQLEWVDHALAVVVRNLLEHSQQELHEQGYGSGIHTDSQSLEVVDGNDSQSLDYVVEVALHMSDMPTAEPAVNLTSNNRIRFYSVTDSLEIHCQFSNSKMQSKVFVLSFHHGEQQAEQGMIQALVDDFMSFVLLSRRSGLALY
ncbi:MAG: hypothetical protein RPT25_05750 [Cycloclasticus sp.]